MLDKKDLFSNKDEYIKRLSNKGFDLNLIYNEIEKLNNLILKENSKIIPLREKRNIISKKIGSYKKENNKELLKKELLNANEIAKKLDKFGNKIIDLEKKLNNILLEIPNLPNKKIIIGREQSKNKILNSYFENRKNDFALPHYVIAEQKQIIDFERGRKVSGSRFNYIINQGAKLYQALINFMIDTQIKNGFNQIFTPLMVNTQAMMGTGQLPKFIHDQYKIENESKWLIPTGEVSITNYYSNEILKEDELNKSFFSLTPCFRKEAGAAGKDNKGILRMHQFLKLELVKIINPKDDDEEFLHLLESSKSILDKLKLPYREVELCSGDLGFSANKTIDLEVWMPSEKKYREVSSISKFDNFQARRMKTRFQNTKTNNNELVYTQNASGLAVDRTFAAILENYQNKDNEILIPEALRKYIDIDKI